MKAAALILVILGLFLLFPKSIFADAPTTCWASITDTQLGWWNLCGYVFKDNDSNRDWDNGDSPFPGVGFTYQVYLNGIQIHDSDGVSITQDGSYQIWGAHKDQFGNPLPNEYQSTDIVTFVIHFIIPNDYTVTRGPKDFIVNATLGHPFQRFDLGLAPKSSLCRPTDHIPDDPEGSQEDAVVAPSLKDDRKIVQSLMTLTMPSELILQLITEPPTVAIGVRQGFPSLICSLGAFSSIDPKITDKFCAKPLDLTMLSDTTDTNIFTNFAKAIVSSKRPINVRPKPLPSDCFLGDFKDNNDPAKRSFGNQDLDDINTSLGTKDGFYQVDLPNIPEPTPNPDHGNLSLKQKVFNADHRVPDVNQKCALYNKAHFPPGVAPCDSPVP